MTSPQLLRPPRREGEDDEREDMKAFITRKLELELDDRSEDRVAILIDPDPDTAPKLNPAPGQPQLLLKCLGFFLLLLTQLVE